MRFQKKQEPGSVQKEEPTAGEETTELGTDDLAVKDEIVENEKPEADMMETVNGN